MHQNSGYDKSIARILQFRLVTGGLTLTNMGMGEGNLTRSHGGTEKNDKKATNMESLSVDRKVKGRGK